MDALERLKRDHLILRSKLTVVESALRMGPETWFILQEVCWTLARQLRDHIRREEALLIAGAMSVRGPVFARLAVEHREEPEHLRAINRLFAQEPGGSIEHLRAPLTRIIRGLRRHMDEEEAELFPALARALRGEEPVGEAPPKASYHLDEVMTVNRVVQTFPSTRAVFAQLFINIPIEGSTCLDEVAWRHGLELQDLLCQLETVMGPCDEKRQDPLPDGGILTASARREGRAPA